MFLSHAYRVMAALLRGTFHGLTGGGWRVCEFCAHQVPAFVPWRGGSSSAPPIVHALHMIGSDMDNFACPCCGSTDRERHLHLYLERTGIANEFRGKRILHFAPELQLSGWISTFEPLEYVLADLSPSKPSVRRINMESIPFGDGYFDCVIANHVLEHVCNLTCATEEVARVLKINGIAILQVPWCAGLSKTIEDQAVEDSYARRHLYGQEDHQRLFGRDVYDRLSNEQLVAAPISHEELLSDIDPYRYGVNQKEPFMRFYRR